MAFLLLLVLTVAVVLATRFAWRRVQYDLHKIPTPPGNVLFGHTLDFVFGQAGRQMALWLRKQHEQLGRPKLMKIHLFAETWVFVADATLSKEVLLSKTHPFVKGKNFSPFVLMLGANSTAKAMMLTPSPTPHVMAVRRIYASAFQSANLKRAMSKVNGILDRVIDIIETERQQGPLDCQKLFVRMAIDVVGEVAFDVNLGGLDGSRELYQLLMDAGHILRAWSSNPLAYHIARLFPNSKYGKELEQFPRLVAEWDWLTKDIMAREDPDDGDEPIWYGLKHLKDEDTGKPLEYNSTRAEVATVVFGAMDTTGLQLAWIFALLATHPHVVERLLEELREHGLLGDNAREVTFEDLGSLHYLHAIVKEGMRVAHIFISSLFRKATKDTNLGGYRLPKGTHVRILGNRAANSENDWEDPETFLPERWLGDVDLSNKLNLGFLKGQRDCVGQKLAMLVMRLTVLQLLARYEFRLEGTYEDLIRTSEGLLIRAGNGIWITPIPRSK